MKRWLLFALVIVSALIGAMFGTLLTLKYFADRPSYHSIEERQNLQTANFLRDTSFRIPSGLNFEAAAKMVTPAVVHIRTVYGLGNFSLNALDNYLNPHAQSSGSGVVISDDGYIVTNHHVIEDATSIEVVMNNNQRFFAKVIGRDPSTDLALIKVKAKNLPFVKYGNSDNVTMGEWVLAIGNPFDLNSTVTAGIVSARARNIGILRDKNNLQIESFIQTDAAVNPGNSGGALVNLEGELIGINSAIATATGSYSGYSFAIPVSLVKKIMDDLLEYGEVQRGLLGVQIADVTAALADEEKLDVVQGVFIRSVNKGSAAEQAGIETGDVITEINQHHVSGVSEMQEWVARNRPGQVIHVTYRRSGKDHQVKAVLRKLDGTNELKKMDYPIVSGLEVEDLSYGELNKLSLDGAVRVKSLTESHWKKSGLKENFIITHIDKIPVDNVSDFNRIMEMKKGGVLVEGIFESGEMGVFGVEIE
ncbi:MAG: trypsin-like peptidase domain-containing protein [Chryseotalea sp. WA131a]|jgi:Do/DeqQ family serine protease|nr:MAG: trypsin-like peptidase domain-containing protein [Chryseotalea sp. WA131a]